MYGVPDRVSARCSARGGEPSTVVQPWRSRQCILVNQESQSVVDRCASERASVFCDFLYENQVVHGYLAERASERVV